MRVVSATAAKQKFAEMLDTVQREPVVIRRHERDVAVVISMDDYERLRRAHVDDFNAFCDRVGAEAEARGMTEEILAELLRDES